MRPLASISLEHIVNLKQDVEAAIQHEDPELLILEPRLAQNGQHLGGGVLGLLASSSKSKAHISGTRGLQQ